MMSKTVFLYPGEVLPDGFSYPENYLQLRNRVEVDVLDFLIWDFPNDDYGHATLSWRLRHHGQSEGWLYLDEIDPIPFARNGDWEAYFDGNDHSGDPKVVVADLGNKKNSYKLSNFDEWLDQALKDSGLEK